MTANSLLYGLHMKTRAALPSTDSCFFTVFAHGAFLAFGGSIADSVFRVNARTHAHTRARAFEILVGNVRHLAAMQTCRIAEQEIAFAVQTVGAVLVNDHARILFKSHLECDTSGEAAAQGRRHDHFIRPLRGKDKNEPQQPFLTQAFWQAAEWRNPNIPFLTMPLAATMIGSL